MNILAGKPELRAIHGNDTPQQIERHECQTVLLILQFSARMGRNCLPAQVYDHDSALWNEPRLDVEPGLTFYELQACGRFRKRPVEHLLDTHAIGTADLLNWRATGMGDGSL
ncbi:hypothetical protein EBB59_03695 [Lysobacter pythonis]|uniref:Uncharacterized protein n=1 Tax=Solilutibacter pythonis TaxID=2483112 RepID=A0A3M2I3G2_9GAMM|nr:hypothetical protein [Lysobacter pythonis]RMH93762.1 hypothetical protein EBB59_03695 [Lysobacter pythonis]